MSPQRTTCIYVGAESMLHFESASFSNSFKTDSSMHNNALLQCRYPTLGPKLCLEYPSNPLQINFLVTDTLTVNGFHLALCTPVPRRLFKYSRFCPGLDGVCALLSYQRVISVALLFIPLSLEFQSTGWCAEC